MFLIRSNYLVTFWSLDLQSAHRIFARNNFAAFIATSNILLQLLCRYLALVVLVFRIQTAAVPAATSVFTLIAMEIL